MFAQMTADCPYTLQWFARFRLKIAPFMGDLDPMVPWAHPSPEPKWQLDRFSHFARLTSVTD